MKRLPVALGLLAGCQQGDDIAYIQEFDRVQVTLDNQRPSRSWNLHVETNAEARRNGPTWTTVDAGTTLTIEALDPWQDQFVDASLYGVTPDDGAEQTMQFTEPGQLTMNLRARYQADCVQGEACVWDYLLAITRREGSHGDVALDIGLRALVTLGNADEASESAEMSIEAEELIEE